MDFDIIDIENISTEEMSNLEKQVLKLIGKIEISKKLQDCEDYFIPLEKIQSILATASFKYNKRVSAFLRKFIYDFDRVDDVETRQYLYSLIKAKKYIPNP